MKKFDFKKSGVVLTAAFLMTAPLFAKGMGNTFNSELRIKSRTSFGIDLDNPYNLGLKQELLDFQYVMHVGPGYASNYFKSTGPVGFINFSFYDVAITPVNGDDADNIAASRGAGSFYDYWDSGRFQSGIAWDNWIITLNGKNTESFWLPWNKAFEVTDDKIRVSWASMDTVLGAVRTKRIAGVEPLATDVVGSGINKWNGKTRPSYLVEQDAGDLDKLHFAVDGQMVGVMYNNPDLFGVNAKFATEYAFDEGVSSVHDYNGIAVGLDFVFTPKFENAPEFLKPLRVMGSAAGTWNYGADHDDDPFAFGVKASYAYKINADISIEPFAGLDVGLFLLDDRFAFTTVSSSSKTQYKSGTGDEYNGTALAGGGYEASAGVTVRWPGQGGWLKDYITGDEGRVFPGMSLVYRYYDNPYDDDVADHSVKFTLYEPTGHDGVLYFVGSEVIADLRAIGTEQWELMFTGYIDCPLDFVIKHGILTPFATVYYDNVPVKNGSDYLRQNAVKTDLGVKLSEIIPNTVLSVLWNSGNLVKDDAAGTDVTKGFVRCCAEITF